MVYWNIQENLDSCIFWAGEGQFWGDFPPFCVLAPRDQTCQLFNCTSKKKNWIFWGATFELIKNLSTLVPKNLTGFYETLLYHCYTLVPLPHSCWPRMVWCVINIFQKNGMIIANGTICYSNLYCRVLKEFRRFIRHHSSVVEGAALKKFSNP